MHEAEANTLVDRVEHMYEQQFGQLPNGQLHVSAEVRDAYVKMHPVLKTARYDDEAATAILELLILGVKPESLMQELPTLTKVPSSKDPLALRAVIMGMLTGKVRI